jgi:spore maturation protein A
MEQQEQLSRSGAMLFVVNATSVQLIPTTVIGLRASMGSTNSADIILPNLLATLATSVLGISLVFLFYGTSKRPKTTNTYMFSRHTTQKG